MPLGYINTTAMLQIDSRSHSFNFFSHSLHCFHSCRFCCVVWLLFSAAWLAVFPLTEPSALSFCANGCTSCLHARQVAIVVSGFFNLLLYFSSKHVFEIENELFFDRYFYYDFSFVKY